MKCPQRHFYATTPHKNTLFQILASFTNGSLPNIWQSTSKEINKRIKHAIEVRSSERMHREHITSLALVFKDGHIEEKVSLGLSGREAGGARRGGESV